MSETIRNEMRDDLEDSLMLIIAALARVEIRVGDPSGADLEVGIHQWQSSLWGAADDMGKGELDFRNWGLIIGLEDAIRNWVRAADAYTLYRQMACEWREDMFYQAIGPCQSKMKNLSDGAKF